MNNDDKILLLQKQIEEKKAKVESGKRFAPVTNCVLKFREQTYNLNVLQREGLALLLVELHVLNDKALEMELDLTLSGYSIQDWIQDVTSKLSVLDVREEMSKLKQMEQKLSELLSNEKRVELEIEAIAELLK